MQLPVLSEWTTTRRGLHQAAQVLGAVRAAIADPEPNWTHLGLRIVPNGLATGDLPGVGTLMLDFSTQTIVYDAPDHKPVGFALTQYTQISLADAVSDGLKEMGHPVELKRDKITGDEVFEINPVSANDYARILATMNTILGAFRAELPGEKSPLIVWPHGFDLAFLWFATEEATEAAPHMGFGFSPYSAGLERPYIYSYAYPVPDNLTEHDLPPGTRWHTEGWTGSVTDYDHIARQQESVALIEDMLRTVFETVSPLLTS